MMFEMIEMNAKQYRITLGPGWQRYVKAKPGVEMLGVICHHYQIGALAKLGDNSYAQLNGDWIAPLNASRVRHALSNLRPAHEGLHVASGRKSVPSSASVKVTVRKRRTIQMVANSD